MTSHKSSSRKTLSMLRDGSGEVDLDCKSAKRVRNVGEVEEAEPDPERSAGGDMSPCLGIATRGGATLVALNWKEPLNMATGRGTKQSVDDATSVIPPGF